MKPAIKHSIKGFSAKSTQKQSWITSIYKKKPANIVIKKVKILNYYTILNTRLFQHNVYEKYNISFFVNETRFKKLTASVYRNQLESRPCCACALSMAVISKWLLSKKTKTGVSYSTAAEVWRWSICSAHVDAKGNSNSSLSMTSSERARCGWRWISLFRENFLQESFKSTGL